MREPSKKTRTCVVLPKDMLNRSNCEDCRLTKMNQIKPVKRKMHLLIWQRETILEDNKTLLGVAKPTEIEAVKRRESY